MITEIALTSAVRAALAVELLRDLVEADVIDVDTLMAGALLPDDVLRLHAAARVRGRPVRALGQFLDEVGARVLPAIEDMRAQLACHAVSDDQFDTAVRRLLRGAAS